jgi:hypothetical protein
MASRRLHATSASVEAANGLIYFRRLQTWSGGTLGVNRSSERVEEGPKETLREETEDDVLQLKPGRERDLFSKNGGVTGLVRRWRCGIYDTKSERNQH